MEQGWFKVNSASEYSDVSSRTMRTWLKEGLEHSKIRGTILVKREVLDHWLESFSVSQDKGAEVDKLVNEVMEGIK